MVLPNFVAGYLVDPSTQKDPLYLLLKRSADSYLPGIWQMITGKVNSEESANMAVQREILEETGLRCSKIYNVDVTMFYEQPKSRIAFSANFCAFASSLDPVVLAEDEHDEFRWITFPEACTLLSFPAQKETLAFIHEHYVMKKVHAANLVKTI